VLRRRNQGFLTDLKALSDLYSFGSVKARTL
jgi:hypothetical protein